MSDDFLVSAEHLATAPNWVGSSGLCHRGARAWFAAHGLDWLKFCCEGVPASTLLATGDAIAQRVVDHARAEVQGGR